MWFDPVASRSRAVRDRSKRPRGRVFGTRTPGRPRDRRAQECVPVVPTPKVRCRVLGRVPGPALSGTIGPASVGRLYLGVRGRRGTSEKG